MGLVPPTNNFFPANNVTASFRSIGILIALLMIPLFFMSVVAFYAVTVIQDLGLAVGFSIGFLDTIKNAITVFDSIIIFVFAAGFGAAIIRSFRVNTPGVLAFAGLVVLPIVVYISAYASNAFGVFANLSIFQGIINNFPLATVFFQNSALIAAGTGVLVLLVMVGGGLIRR